MSTPALLDEVARYYQGRLARFGPTPAGVDWRDEVSQTIRFDQLLRVIAEPSASVVDLGCGYGALLTHLRRRGFTGGYRGVDIAPAMIAAAVAGAAAGPDGTRPDVVFEQGEAPSAAADYAVASGIFNVRLGHEEAAWQDYVAATIAVLDRAGRRGFAFNCLTAYADPERMRGDLFYADPCRYFDLCRRRYSRHVALLHDYGLW